MITVTISGEEYQRCSKYSKNNWSSSKPGRYGKGLGNSSKDASKIERVSKLSELAVSKLLRSADPDFSFRKYGDGGTDLTLHGLKIDVKCAMRDYGANVFKGVSKGGRSTVTADLYIFCYLSKEVAEFNTACIEVVGFLTKDEVLALDLVPPRVKFTKDPVNYDIRHSNMTPVEELLSDLGANDDKG